MSVLDQIRKLDEQRNQLLSAAKKEALDAANAAIRALNDLGYNYRLTTDDRTPSTGTRRTGMRDQVLQVIKTAGAISPKDILSQMNATTDADKTSVRNALSALKKNDQVDTKDGKYFVKA